VCGHVCRPLTGERFDAFDRKSAAAKDVKMWNIYVLTSCECSWTIHQSSYILLGYTSEQSPTIIARISHSKFWTNTWNSCFQKNICTILYHINWNWTFVAKNIGQVCPFESINSMMKDKWDVHNKTSKCVQWQLIKYKEWLKDTLNGQYNRKSTSKEVLVFVN
jgi:hypothetical protein